MLLTQAILLLTQKKTILKYVACIQEGTWSYIEITLQLDLSFFKNSNFFFK